MTVAAAKKTCSSRPCSSLPGDLEHEALVARILRVDHAGEYGAQRIYAGQKAMLAPNSVLAKQIEHMAEQEEQHFAVFDELLRTRRVRPSVLHPLWHASGFLLGAATAMMGPRAAMACTIAVEEVIEEHYAKQLEVLGEREPELRAHITQFRDEEIEHRDIAADSGGRDIAGYELLSGAIKTGSRLAIWLAERF